jgi:hypothetical protein
VDAKEQTRLARHAPPVQVPVRQVREGTNSGHEVTPAVERTDEARDNEKGVAQQRHYNGVDRSSLEDKNNEEEAHESVEGGTQMWAAVRTIAIADAVAQLRGTELARAREVWRKKFDQPARDAAERAKQYRFLATRGFSGEVVAKLLGDPHNEWGQE